MARIRNIKPEFFLNEDLADLPAETRLAFIGLWTQADCMGRMEDRPKRLKMTLFPYDTKLDMDKLLNQLAERGFIMRYENGGKFIQINTFCKHQCISNRETAAGSSIPGPVNSLQVLDQASTKQVQVQDQSSTGTGSVQDRSDDIGHRTQDTGQDSCSELAEPTSEPAAGVWKPTEANKFRTDSGPYPVDPTDIAIWMPVVACKDERGWPLTKAHLQSLLTAYQPAIDGPALAREVKSARVWLESNPSRRKHPSGMPQFLNNWLKKAVNGARL